MGASASSSKSRFGCGYLDALRIRILLYDLGKIDAVIVRSTERTIQCIEAEEEQSKRARYWLDAAFGRPGREGRAYTQTDVLACQTLERKLGEHQFNIRTHLANLGKFSAARINNDKVRQMAAGGNHAMAEITRMQAKLNKNPVQDAMRAQMRDLRTAAIITQQNEAAVLAAEGDRAIRSATDDVHIELEKAEEEELDDDVDIARHAHKVASLSAIEQRFIQMAMGSMPAPPTQAPVLAPTPTPLSPPRSTALSPGTRSKRQAGKQYAELEEESKSELLEL